MWILRLGKLWQTTGRTTSLFDAAGNLTGRQEAGSKPWSSESFRSVARPPMPSMAPAQRHGRDEVAVDEDRHLDPVDVHLCREVADFPWLNPQEKRERTVGHPERVASVVVTNDFL